MTSKDDDLQQPDEGLIEAEGLVRVRSDEEIASAEPDDELPQTEAQQMGSARFVHSAFFVAGILAAYIGSKALLGFWNRLAEWPLAVRTLPQLVTLAEAERGTVCTGLGAVLGLLAVIHFYRKPQIRTWADEVVGELSKVAWPNREAVTNGTLIVVVASLIATVYVALLDRLWGFLTTLVYGA
jgi:preprotein translocase subunit SecE